MVNTKKIKAIVLSSMLACIQLQLAVKPDEAQVPNGSDHRVVNAQMQNPSRERIKTNGDSVPWYDKRESFMMMGMYGAVAANVVGFSFPAVAGTLLGVSGYVVSVGLTKVYNKTTETNLQKLEREVKDLETKTKAMNELIERYKTLKENLLVIEAKEEDGIETRYEYVDVNISPISPREA